MSLNGAQLHGGHRILLSCMRGGQLVVLPMDDLLGSPYLLHLAFQTMKSSSVRLASSTWRNYLRCVQKAVDFTIKRCLFSRPQDKNPVRCHALFSTFTSEWYIVEFDTYFPQRLEILSRSSWIHRSLNRPPSLGTTDTLHSKVCVCSSATSSSRFDYFHA